MHSVIHLRRPAVVQVSPDTWLPDAALGEQAERRWAVMLDANENLFNGRLLHVVGVHRNGHGGATIQTMPCDFKWYAVQADGPDCGCRPLGVKGLVQRDGCILMGRRASWTTFHGDAWECAPSGGVEPSQTPEEAIEIELREETGLSVTRSPRARAVVFDDTAMSWEVVFELTIAADATPVAAAEYTSLRWCSPKSMPSPLTPTAQRMLAMLG
jgi:8-oxo-dGTP pyrophosphatase MutT (NUDIX family)